MMFVRRIFAAFAALVVSTTLIESVAAYPVTALSGKTTVTRVYRPLDLNLSLVNGTNALAYDSISGAFSFSASYNGTYTGTGPGYGSTPPSPVAGNWKLNFQSSANDDDESVITASSPVSGLVGSLTYLGLGSYVADGVPYVDRPQENDVFKLYAASGSAYMEVSCQDGVATCLSFVVNLLQDLKHLGPFKEGEGLFLDGAFCLPGQELCDRFSRVNQDCFVPDSLSTPQPCGVVPADGFRASSEVPEPASLALVGLGLFALGLGRRRQQRLRGA